jgi:surface antigen
MLKVLLLSLVGSASISIVWLPALMPPQAMVMPAAGFGPVPAAGPAGPAATGHVVRIDPLQPVFPNVPPGGFAHDTYAWHQCTWWAAYNHLVPPYLGDGGRWLANAAASGLPTSSQPSVGAVVVYRPSPGYDTVHGHVALVIAVAATSFRVSEMNFVGLGVVDERDSPWPDWHVAGFLP